MPAPGTGKAGAGLVRGHHGEGEAGLHVQSHYQSALSQIIVKLRQGSGKDRTLKLIATRHHHHPQVEFYLTNGQVR